MRLPGEKKTRFSDRIPLSEDEIRNCLKLSLIAQQPQQKANKPTNETAECYWLNAPGGPSLALRSHFKLRPPKVSILVFYAQSVPQPKTTPTKSKQTINECYWRNPPVRSGKKAISDSVFSPKTTPINRKQTNKPSVTDEMPLQAEPDQQPLQTLSVRPKQPQQKGGGGGRVLPAKSSLRPIPTRSYLKLSLFAQNNPNKRLLFF